MDVVEHPNDGRTELSDILAGIDRDNPDRDHLAKLKQFLSDNPQAWHEIEPFTRRTVDDVIQRHVRGDETSLLFLREELDLLRRSLGIGESGPIERLLIEHVVLCWLRIEIAERAYSMANSESGSTLRRLQFHEKRLSATQRRYLRALETLARIRKMGPAVLQFNVAQQQIVANG